MKSRFSAGILLFGLLLGTLVVFAAGAPKQKPEVAAQVAVEKWLPLLDGGNYDGSWNELAKPFKDQVKKRDWRKAMESLRKPLGKVVSRKLVSAEFTKDLPGAPEGEYVVLKFDTVFQNRSNAVETVTPTLETDLSWRVSGYTVK
jgi:hypothetical protein